VKRHHNRPVPSPPQSQPVVSTPPTDDDLYEVTDQVSHSCNLLLITLCLFIHINIIQGGPKDGLFLRVDNFAIVNWKKACNRPMSKVSEHCLKRYKTCMLMHLNIFCLISINLHYTWNYAKFAKTVIMYAAGTRITHLPYLQRWLPVSAGWSTGTPYMLHCCLPALPYARVYWTRKLAYYSLDLYPMNYAVWTMLQKMLYRDKISDIDWLKHVIIECWTHKSQETLNWVINQLPTDDGYPGKGWQCWFCLDKFCVQMIVAITFPACSSSS